MRAAAVRARRRSRPAWSPWRRAGVGCRDLIRGADVAVANVLAGSESLTVVPAPKAAPFLVHAHAVLPLVLPVQLATMATAPPALGRLALPVVNATEHPDGDATGVVGPVQRDVRRTAAVGAIAGRNLVDAAVHVVPPAREPCRGGLPRDRRTVAGPPNLLQAYVAARERRRNSAVSTTASVGSGAGLSAPSVQSATGM